jgi:hypothetical protein
MSFAAMSWLLLLAYALHMLEEFMLNWRDWARGVLGLPVGWPDFYVTNALVVVLGIGAAELAGELPILPLAFAALMLINATLFHVAPMIAFRGRFSPGAMTAVVLFYPAAGTAFVLAGREGLLSAGVVLGAFFIGALLMAYPIVLLKARGLPYVQQASAR